MSFDHMKKLQGSTCDEWTSQNSNVTIATKIAHNTPKPVVEQFKGFEIETEWCPFEGIPADSTTPVEIITISDDDDTNDANNANNTNDTTSATSSTSIISANEDDGSKRSRKRKMRRRGFPELSPKD